MLIERATPPYRVVSTRRRQQHIGNILLCLRHYHITFAVHRGTPSMCCVAVGKEFFHGYT